MEIIRGKKTSLLDPGELNQMALPYAGTLLDIGTGDGRFIDKQAEAFPNRFFVGVDACRENLRVISRKARSNTIFLIANALELPPELRNLATHVTINFPWGSLLNGLLDGSERFLDALTHVTQRRAHLEVRLNAGALAEAGWTLDEGDMRIRRVLNGAGFFISPTVSMEKTELMACPTTWSKRLAFGRDPRARLLVGRKN